MPEHVNHLSAQVKVVEVEGWHERRRTMSVAGREKSERAGEA